MQEHDLEIGDLVTHVLYGRGWIGMIIEFHEEAVKSHDKRNKKALVQIQPGTEYEGFFRRASDTDRMNDNLGYVSIHWLFKVKEKDGDTRSTRSKTSSGRRNSKKLS
jgi:hypothetical protein